jgi:hypothetical protein
MPDGVSIRGGEDLRQIVASWNVYVTLDPPIYPVHLAQQLEALNLTFELLSTFRGGGIQGDLRGVYMRKHKLESMLKHAVPKERVRRGLIDVGGYALHALFVATSAQLKRFQDALTEVIGRQQEITHAHNNLATIVNQTQTHLRRLSYNVHQVALQIKEVRDYADKISDVVKSTVHDVERLKILGDIDRYLDVMELAVAEYMDQVALFHRQRAELSLGRLTRNLLTSTQLDEILQQATTQHQAVSNLDWYYLHLLVTPVWRYTSSLLYQVEIPLVAARPYLMYYLVSHPVPLANSTYAVHLSLERQNAVDTVSGKLFIPRLCIGTGPTLGRTGPEFGPSLLKCARGLLTSQPKLMTQCKMEAQDYAGEPLVATMDTNQYAVTTLGETLAVRCPGRTETHHELKSGTYNVTCLRPCRITGEGWSVECIDRLYLTRKYVMPEVRAPQHFNFSSPQSIDKLVKSLPQLGKIYALQANDWDVPAADSPLHFDRPITIPRGPSIMAIINTTFIVILVLAVIALAIACKLHHRKLGALTIKAAGYVTWPVQGQTPAMAQPALGPPVQPIATPPIQAAPRVRIWPLLPPAAEDSLEQPQQAPAV